MYKVSNAIMSGVFDFTEGKFKKGEREAWAKFFQKAAGPKKWRKEVVYSGLTVKIRVIHASKQKCPAVSIMTISRSQLVETAKEFPFVVTSSKPVASVCNCLWVEENDPETSSSSNLQSNDVPGITLYVN